MDTLIISMLIFLVMGVPIGYAIGLGSVVYILLETDISLMLVELLSDILSRGVH